MLMTKVSSLVSWWDHCPPWFRWPIYRWYIDGLPIKNGDVPWMVSTSCAETKWNWQHVAIQLVFSLTSLNMWISSDNTWSTIVADNSSNLREGWFSSSTFACKHVETLCFPIENHKISQMLHDFGVFEGTTIPSP
jgi:hypothetical protein